MATVNIYTDGAYDWGTGVGGWAALIIQEGERRVISGHQREGTTSQRMELLAAIKALETIPEGSTATLSSDSQYLIKDMRSRQPGARPRKRNVNLDLWRRLDELASTRDVRWEWVAGHTGHLENEEVNLWAAWEAGLRKEPPPEYGTGATQPSPLPQLSHLDEEGKARMVDVGKKPETHREAMAKGTIFMQQETLRLIQNGALEKGDVLATARLAGIMAAKATPHLIPLCHPIPLSHVSVEFEQDPEASAIHITATAGAFARTGVEMEALTAVAVAALTIYDMCKAVDRGMRIERIRLVRKAGGASGEIRLE